MRRRTGGHGEAERGRRGERNWRRLSTINSAKMVEGGHFYFGLIKVVELLTEGMNGAILRLDASLTFNL